MQRPNSSVDSLCLRRTRVVGNDTRPKSFTMIKTVVLYKTQSRTKFLFKDNVF